MKKLLPLFLLPLFSVSLSGQAEFIQTDTPYVRVSVPDAAILAYWGSKGIACETLLPSLYREINLKSEKAEFQDKIIENYKKAQEEYRAMFNAAVAKNQDTEKNLAVAKAMGDEWKRKAKARSETLWALGGSAAAIVAGILFTK